MYDICLYYNTGIYYAFASLNYRYNTQKRKMTKQQRTLTNILVHAAGQFCYLPFLRRRTEQLIRLIGDLPDEVLGDAVEEPADEVILEVVADAAHVAAKHKMHVSLCVRGWVHNLTEQLSLTRRLQELGLEVSVCPDFLEHAPAMQHKVVDEVCGLHQSASVDAVQVEVGRVVNFAGYRIRVSGS